MTSLAGLVDAHTLLAICVMAATTVFNRTAGFLLMRLVPLTPRVRKILDSLPGAVLVAIVAPTAVHGDLAMILGLGAAFLATRLTKNDFIAVLAAVAVAAGVRALGF